MKLCGHFYEVTQLASFVQDYVTNGSCPDPYSIRPIRDARVMLCGWNQTAPRSRSLVECNTDQSGRFELHDSIVPDTSALLVASDDIDLSERAGGQDQIAGYWYRSLPFVSGGIDELHRDLYVTRLVIPNESGFSQAELAAVLSDMRQQIVELEWITGTITPRGIILSCGGKGARASARLVLTPDLSGDPSKILGHSIEDFQLELPGLSWLVGLVVPRDLIEARIRAGLRDLAGEISNRLRRSVFDLFSHQIARADPAAVVRLAEETTLSLARLRYTTTSSSGPLKVSYTLTGDACLGFPRTLVRKDSQL